MLAKNQCCSLLGAGELWDGVTPANGGRWGTNDEEVDLSRVRTISQQRNKAMTGTEGIQTVGNWTLCCLPTVHLGCTSGSSCTVRLPSAAACKWKSVALLAQCQKCCELQWLSIQKPECWFAVEGNYSDQVC